MNLHSKHSGKGPPAILTTGIGHASTVWDSLVQTLENRFTTWTWDYRGHGRSEATDNPEDYSPLLAMTDLMSMMERAGAGPLNKSVLIGHSLGGYLSLRAALEVPSHVQALVLIATGPGFRDDAAREKWNAYARTIDIDRGVPPAARQMSLQLDTLVIQGLSSIEVPTLVIVGSADRHFLGAKDYLVRKMPNAASIEIPEARHSVHISHSLQVNEAISNFLGEHS